LIVLASVLYFTGTPSRRAYNTLKPDMNLGPPAIEPQYGKVSLIRKISTIHRAAPRFYPQHRRTSRPLYAQLLTGTRGGRSCPHRGGSIEWYKGHRQASPPQATVFAGNVGQRACCGIISLHFTDSRGGPAQTTVCSFFLPLRRGWLRIQ
jgi:hypothetical protein